MLAAELFLLFQPLILFLGTVAVVLLVAAGILLAFFALVRILWRPILLGTAVFSVGCLCYILFSV